MSAVVNLTELAAARARMTQGTWVLDDDTPCIYVGDVEVVVIADEADNYDGDGPGLVATHNAADVLIEVARAAKALESAQAQWREQGDATVQFLDAARIALRRARPRFWLFALDVAEAVNAPVNAPRGVYLWLVGKASDAVDWGVP